jgi:glycosyltransferase involved in cell wall biosynthesis
VLNHITPLLLTLDEELNISRTISALKWAMDIVVVDSGSSDRTKDLLATIPQVRVFDHRFESHASQWNFGLTQTGIKSKWVLALDADQVLSPELVAELAALPDAGDFSAFEASFVYCVFGQPLRGSLYPAKVVLFEREKAEFFQDGHTQRVSVSGQTGSLKERIYHDDRKPFNRWLESQGRYGVLEARKLLDSKWKDLSITDRMRRSVVLSPPAALLYSLIFKGCLLDGWPGWYYALQRMMAESTISLAILDARLRKRTRNRRTGN